MQNKISILIVIYNSLDKFKKCFDSINKKLLNREDIFELIVFDNNSDEETKAFLKSLETNSKIKIFYSDKNLGCGGARKKINE
jgi:glycosyltransferase involved in cell wall biosynthesis